MDIIHWNHNEEDRLELANVGTPTDPKLLKLNANFCLALRRGAESLFTKYIDIFVFSYKDLCGILEYIATRRINLDPTISPNHQARSRMNFNYTQVVQDDLEQLLTIGFIAPVDRASWLLSIVVVLKKNGKLRICIDFRRLNTTTKKDPYLLPCTVEVLDTLIRYEAYSILN